MLTEILFFDLVNKFLQLFAYFYENFHFENFFSDMLLYHQQDQVEKMYFEIVFNLPLHQVDDKATCQTQVIF